VQEITEKGCSWLRIARYDESAGKKDLVLCIFHVCDNNKRWCAEYLSRYNKTRSITVTVYNDLSYFLTHQSEKNKHKNVHQEGHVSPNTMQREDTGSL
jgi:hypothetical protein